MDADGFQFGNQFMGEFSNPRMVNVPRITHSDQNLVNEHDSSSSFGGLNLCPKMSFPCGFSSSKSVNLVDDCNVNCGFSDAVLSYIDKILMEEDMDDKADMLQESLDFQAKERSFYEVLGKKYPPSPESPHINSSRNVPNGLKNESTDYRLQMSDKQTGFEEVSRQLPTGRSLLLVDFVSRGLLDQAANESYGKKHSHGMEMDLEKERSNKLSAVRDESDISMQEFDDVLLNTIGERGKKFAAYRAELQHEASKQTHCNEQTKGSKVRSKKQNRKKEVIDLRTLLIKCAQTIAADDSHNANEQLKLIRQHSSPLGDGNQRLAHYIADGLESRLVGTGSRIHKALITQKISAAGYLRAYYTYLASCPFKKVSNFVSNRTIREKSGNATKVHIIDFGILYGFQWPTFMQRLSEREAGIPKLRITGIDFPQPGFRPAERVEETGRRLAHYAEIFNVSFEYNAVAKKWEIITVEDLKIEEDEFVVVNSLFRTKSLFDETVVAESSKTIVLKLIRKINPHIFIHSIVNGSYSAPFFITRFREVLFHFSAIFDMLETNIPRDKPERLLLERDVFGREALNVIACEGWERVERPETYKQWQVRNLKAGFIQVSIEKQIVEKSKNKVKLYYHKDFIIDEDSHWLLMGWKGRMIYAISCWKPA